jgi:hypothetical protein
MESRGFNSSPIRGRSSLVETSALQAKRPEPARTPAIRSGWSESVRARVRRSTVDPECARSRDARGMEQLDRGGLRGAGRRAEGGGGSASCKEGRARPAGPRLSETAPLRHIGATPQRRNARTFGDTRAVRPWSSLGGGSALTDHTGAGAVRANCLLAFTSLEPPDWDTPLMRWIHRGDGVRSMSSECQIVRHGLIPKPTRWFAR